MSERIEVGREYVDHVDPWTDEERLTDEEVVRCRDCKHRVAFEQPLNLERVYCGLRYSLYAVEDEGFCAWGERRGE